MDAFTKDLPLERVGPDVLIAYELNGSHAGMVDRAGIAHRLAGAR